MPPIAVSGLRRTQVKSLGQRIIDEIINSLKRASATGTWKDPNLGPLIKEWNIDSIWNRPFGAPEFPRISRGKIMLPGGGAIRTWNNLEKISDPEAIAAR